MDDAELADLLSSFFDAAFRRHANDVRQAHALGLHLSYEDDDARKPIVSAGFNTEAGSHKDLARFGDPSRDPDGAEALNRWIRDRRLWYDEDPRDVSDERFDRLLELDEAIDAGLNDVLATVSERLQRDTVPWVVGRPLPVLIHPSEEQEPTPEELAAEVAAAGIFASSEAEELRWLKFAASVAGIAFALVSAWRAFAHDGTNAKPIDEGAYLYLAATPLLAAVAMDQLRGIAGGGDPEERGWRARLSETRTGRAVVIALILAGVVGTVLDPLGV
jgi:hypothetical protein